jgi:uncharacterized membrane protein
MASMTKTILAIAVAAVVTLGAVGVYMAVSSSSSTGKVTIMVKDLPAEWAHVNVTFSEVRIHQADTNDSGWIKLKTSSQSIDLKALVNVSEWLATGNVSTGKYTQVRIVVESVIGTMLDGAVVNFTVPSGELKINHPFNITAGDTITLTVDIDLAHSITHNSSGWVFKPVLGSILEL